jgi:uncharacterized protein YbjT (DUF2867 family)
MIFVTGATGTVGREVVKLLLDQDVPVRALTRDPAKAKIDPRAAVIAGDTSKPQTFAKALRGVDALFTVVFGPNMAAEEAELARVAKEAGVKHVVKLSALGAGANSANGTREGIAAMHVTAEQALAASGVAWTLVQPTAFMSNVLFQREPIVRAGKIFSNYGDGKIPYVHPRDIAAVAVEALTSPAEHEGQAYPVTGGEALGVADLARTLGDAIGRTIEYVPVTDEATAQTFRGHGMHEVIVGALLPFGAIVRSGRATEVLPTVREVLGREPLTFAEWAREHAGAFQAQPVHAA